MKTFFAFLGTVCFLVALMWAIELIARANNQAATFGALWILVVGLFLTNTNNNA